MHMRGSPAGPAIVWRESWKEASRCMIQCAFDIGIHHPWAGGVRPCQTEHFFDGVVTSSTRAKPVTDPCEASGAKRSRPTPVGPPGTPSDRPLDRGSPPAGARPQAPQTPTRAFCPPYTPPREHLITLGDVEVLSWRDRPRVFLLSLRRLRYGVSSMPTSGTRPSPGWPTWHATLSERSPNVCNRRWEMLTPLNHPKLRNA